MRQILLTVLSVLVLITGTRASAQSVAGFQTALQALDHNQIERFKGLSAPLIGNILYPYLRYAYLQHQIHQDSRAEIDTFLIANSRLPISGTLHRDWLLELARRQDWKDFLAEYRPSGDPQVACAYAEALASTGHLPQALALARQLWLSGDSQPERCDPVFKLLTTHHEMTPDLVRERLMRALLLHHGGLARYLAHQLPTEDGAVVQQWLKVYSTPAAFLETPPGALGTPDERDLLMLAAFTRLARQDPGRAHQLWLKVEARNPDLPPSIRDRVMREIALNAAWDNQPQAEQWLATLPESASDRMVRVWRVRTALREGNWARTLQFIRAMPAYQRNEADWRYWEARSLAALGRPLEAERIATPLSHEFTYYGFLAADFLHQPYAHGTPMPRVSPHLAAIVGRHYLIRVALALEAVGQHADADTAWRAALRHLDSHERLAAADLAYQRGWAYGAYAAAARAGLRNASPLMFPLAHMPHVRTAAAQDGLNPGLLLAVMRQESAFQSTVCSDKGACGLLQLLPETACWISHHSGLGNLACNLKALSTPAINIRAGATYLSYLYRQFSNDVVLALAAYNAGPGTVNHWLSSMVSAPPGSARWLATLPYGETRNYVESVLFNRVIYTHRLLARESVFASHPAATAQKVRLSDTLVPVSLIKVMASPTVQGG